MDIVQELQRIRTLAVEHQIHTVVFLGDIFQERGRLDLQVLNSIYREMEAFRRKKIQVVMLLGNHDRAPVGAFHALEVFKPVAVVVDEPQEVQTGHGRFWAIPYMPDNRHIVANLARRTWSVKLVILHAAVLDGRLPWHDGIKLKAIPEHLWCFMGHYHRFTKLRKKVYYVGSLLQNNWGEAGDRKVFGEFVDGKVTWMPTQGPQFLEITADDISTRSDLKGNFLRVQWPGPVDEVGAVRSYLLETVGARAVDFVFPPPTFQVESMKKLSEDPAVARLLTSYLKTAPVLQRPGLFETGQRILIEAEDLSEDRSKEA